MSDRPQSQQEEASILLVEDDELLAEVLEGLLAPLGAVTWRSRGEEGAAALSRSEFDLVLTDIELPGIGGAELLGLVKAADPAVATLVLSSHQSFDHAVAAIRADADDYLTKPIEVAELTDKAVELIALTRERRGEHAQL